MSTVKLIKQEIELVKGQTDRLIADIDTALWTVSPELINTNLNWQIGHIFVANYFHGIASITGFSKEVRKDVDIHHYVKLYGIHSNPTDNMDAKPTNEEVLKAYELVFEQLYKGLDSLTDADLEQATAIPNPVVETKYQALMWLFKHQSWHNGQIALLRRILNKKT